jgi:hypothetical protein
MARRDRTPPGTVAALTESVTLERVKRLLDRGANEEAVIRLLVSTGQWTEAGAADIVSTLTGGPERQEVGWAGRG